MSKLRYVGGTLLALIALTFAGGCGQPTQSGSSVIRIEIPKNEKLGALASLPTDRKTCFGVSITGDGIPGRAATSCTPATGQLVGFVEPGRAIEATVDYGRNRRIEVFMMLMNNMTEPCPSIGTGFSATQMNKIFLVGASDPFTINSPETQVNVILNYTGIAVGANYPISCSLGNRVSASNPNGFFFGVASGEVSDSAQTLKLRARVGQASEVLRGGNLELKVK